MSRRSANILSQLAAIALLLTKSFSFMMWFNLNGHRAKSNQQESEVSREPKKKPTKVYPRV
jgi:hypothetical protein